METKVELSANGYKRLFGIEHAERILRMSNNGGWVLTDKSYKFNGKSIVKKS